MSFKNANYIVNCQLYARSKQAAPKDSNKAAKSRAIRRKAPNSDCNLCKLVSHRMDWYKILNQGLYNKYTSSLNYYYTKDINAIILRKTKTFAIKFRDDQIFNEGQEYLKKFFKKKEASASMMDIKNFYSKFKAYPQFFNTKIFCIMSAMSRRHRRLEYYHVFKKSKQDDKEPNLREDERFQFAEMLGESFKRVGYKIETSDIGNFGTSHSTPREQRSIVGIKKAFNELFQIKGVAEADHKFSSEYFQYHTTTKNYYQLYSESDSLSALNDFESMMKEFNAKIKNQQHQCKPVIKFQKGLYKSPTDQIENRSPTKYTTREKNQAGYSTKSSEKKGIVEGNKLAPADNLNDQSNDLRLNILNANLHSTKDKAFISLSKQIPVRGNLHHILNLKTEQVTPVASEKKEVNLNKGENSQKDVQSTRSFQRKTFSDNFRHQKIMTTGTAGAPAIKGANKVSTVQESQQSTRKNLEIDVKDFKIDKEETHFNQRPNTVKSSSQLRMFSTRKLNVLVAQPANFTSGRGKKIAVTPSSNGYMLIKRSLRAKSNTHGYNSALVGEASNGGISQKIVAAKYFKSTSQGHIENQEEANDSKVILEKQVVVEGLDIFGSKYREDFTHNSKASISSKNLLEKCFANSIDPRQIASESIKPSNSKERQIKLGVSQRRDRVQIAINPGGTNNDITQNRGFEKLPSPIRRKSGNSSAKKELPLNLNHPSLLNSHSSVAKIRTDIPEHPDLASQIMRENFSSKNLALTPSDRLKPYRESVVSRSTRRNKSTETGEYTPAKAKGFLPESAINFHQKPYDFRS